VSKPIRCAILASGKGSNARVLLQAWGTDILPKAMIAFVGIVSDQPEALALQLGTEYNIDATCIPRTAMTRQEHETRVLQHLKYIDAEHLILAGYMRLFSPTFLEQFSGSILNIHPALLPAFPGLHAIERQYEAGVRVTGATVHHVDAGMDTGAVILQNSITMTGGESLEQFRQRIE
jgi:phosphoribosylglycinamide formyltransferase-1